MDLSTLRSSLLSMLREDLEGGDGNFSEAEIDEAINSAYREFVRIVPSEEDIADLITNETYSAIASQTDYEQPTDFLKPISIKRDTSYVKINGFSEQILDENPYYAPSIAFPQAVIRSGYIVIRPAATEGMVVTLKYIKIPAKLENDSDTPEIKEDLHEFITLGAYWRLLLKIHENEQSNTLMLRWRKSIYHYYGKIPPEEVKQ